MVTLRVAFMPRERDVVQVWSREGRTNCSTARRAGRIAPNVELRLKLWSTSVQGVLQGDPARAVKGLESLSTVALNVWVDDHGSTRRDPRGSSVCVAL